MDIDSALIKYSLKNKDSLLQTCDFIINCKIGTPFISFAVVDTAKGYGIVPINKIKLRKRSSLRPSINDGILGTDGYKAAVRTLVESQGIFDQLLMSFGIDYADLSQTIDKFHALGSSEIRKVIFDFETDVKRRFRKYINSSSYKADAAKAKKSKELVLLKRMKKEVQSKFRVMISLGQDEESILRLFRSTEVETLLEI